MKLIEQQHGAVKILRPDGPLTAEEADQFRTRSLQALKENLGRVVLDASDIPYIDSRGLECLDELADELGNTGQTLKLCAISKTLRQVLELTGLSSRFDHFEDANLAVRSFL